MPLYIVAVRMSGGELHRHVAGCAVVNDDVRPFEAYTRSVESIIKSIDGGTEYLTRDWEYEVATVMVVTKDDGTRYIRTKADGKWGDNLLRLPRYG
jgi:hypothetical protein